MTSEDELLKRSRARKLRALGKPQRVLPHEYARVCAIVDAAHSAGMTYKQIAEQLELDHSTITAIGARRAKTVHRDTFNAVIRLQIDTDFPTGRTRHSSPRVDPTSTLRRLRALTAEGIPAEVIATHMPGHTWSRTLRALMTKGAEFVHASTVEDVRHAYDKLKGVTPEDLGVRPQHVRGAKRKAAALGWAPVSCWDDDTIDDPAAIPEWTGACGTEEGYRIHIRETLDGNPMPPCEACRNAVEVQLPDRSCHELPFVFNHERFSEAMEKRGINPRQLAIKLGRDPREADRFYRWRRGDRNPQNRSEVYAVAAALDLEPGDLMRDATLDEAPQRRKIGEGAFNPYIFRVVVEMSGMSYSKVGEIIGSTHASVGKWISGQFSPAKKEKLQPLAELLGIDLEFFYK